MIKLGLLNIRSHISKARTGNEMITDYNQVLLCLTGTIFYIEKVHK